MIFGKHVNRYYLKHLPMLLLGVVALLAVDFFQLRIPELYRMVINGLNTGFADEGVVFDLDFLLDGICLPLIIIVVIMVIGRFLWRICFFGSAVKVETDLRYRMFDHSKELSQEYFQVNKVGNLMSLYTNDLETIQECFGDGFLMMADACIMGFLSIYKMARMNWMMTLLAMIPMVFLLISATLMGPYLTKRWDARQQAFSDISDFAQENFSGISVIKAFVKEARELDAFRKLNKNNEDTNVAFVRTSTLFHIMITLFVETVTLIILGVGGYMVYNKTLSVGELMEFQGYFVSVVWPVMAVSDLIDMGSRGKASLKRVSELLDEQPAVHDTEAVTPMDDIRGDIEFRHLSFTYPGSDREVLHDISFSIEAGENVGLIGKTGVGKTTLVDLILRTYNVPDGTLFLDGRDVNTIPIKTVRDHAAYVPQDNFLFSDTIESNIAFASESSDTELAEQAAKMSDVHDNIMEFSQGYQTVLGERGVTVSGGQKQRISIARALMKDANILILDDSVSAVDVSTEKVILENLRRIREGKTTILIAHRISTIENMDKIVFLNEGRVEAVGPHDVLYRECPEYKVMVDLQRLDEEKSHEGEEARHE